jgi:hypothetical protein
LCLPQPLLQLLAHIAPSEVQPRGELGRWQTEDVFQCLVSPGVQRLLPGIVESLGKFRRPETIPYFLQALGDGVCRSYAEEAIRNMGETARPALLGFCERKLGWLSRKTSTWRRNRSKMKLPEEWKRVTGTKDWMACFVCLSTYGIKV